MRDPIRRARPDECALLTDIALRSKASRGYGELADLFVEPAHMGAGHGRRLVEHAKSAARARGWQSLLVEADPNAREFYYSCGGAQIGTVASGSIAGRRLPLIKIPL